MIRFKVIFLYISFLYINKIFATPFFDENVDDSTAKKYSEFNCFKLKSCTPGPPKVCGYEMRTRELAEFDDKCTYHRINCAGGFFKIVDMLACESKKAFMAMQNNSLFEWQHINRTSLPTQTDLVATTPKQQNTPLDNPHGAAEEPTSPDETSVWQKVMMPLVKMVIKNMYDETL